MKFFTTALAAFAVGSAMAAPVADKNTGKLPCNCEDDGESTITITTETLPPITITSETLSTTTLPPIITDIPCTTTLSNVIVSPTQVPSVPKPDPSHEKPHGGNVTVVVAELVEVVVEVEAKVKAELELIGNDPTS
jgi:hypothetical protein